MYRLAEVAEESRMGRKVMGVCMLLLRLVAGRAVAACRVVAVVYTTVVLVLRRVVGVELVVCKVDMLPDRLHHSR